MPDSLTKYVQLHGPCEIRVRDLTTLELYFYDQANTAILNPRDPLILDIKDTKRVKFLQGIILGEFTEEGFGIHKSILDEVGGGLTWQDAESPGPLTMPNMNPIHPPLDPTKPQG